MIYTKDGQQYSERQVRLALPNVSLPAGFGPDVVASYGFVPYVPPPLTDEELRASARAKINFWRDTQRNAGFSAIGHQWDSTADARENITNVALSGQGSPTGFWTSAADVDVPVTAQDMSAIYAAMLTRGVAIHVRQREMKAALASMSRAELESFVPGWGT